MVTSSSLRALVAERRYHLELYGTVSAGGLTWSTSREERASLASAPTTGIQLRKVCGQWVDTTPEQRSAARTAIDAYVQTLYTAERDADARIDAAGESDAALAALASEMFGA